MKICRVLGLCLVGAACGGSPTVAPFGGVEAAIVNGSRAPQNTFLTPGQVLAVVFLADTSGAPFCSGTLVAPRAVISARHCTQSVDASPAEIMIGFGVLPDPPLALIPVAEVDENPDVDFSLLILGADALEAVADVVPIALNRVPVDGTWINRWVDAAGYGQTRDASREGRYFASVQVVSSDRETVTVDGHQQQGICFGDSGGPIIYQPDAATPPVVVGTEQWGDDSCVGRDHLTRVDVVAPFVDLRLSEPLPPPLRACHGETLLGECKGGNAVWCENGYVYTRLCAVRGRGCGYLGDQAGFDCLPLACGDIDRSGRCDGDTLQWCNGTSLEIHDCAAANMTCGYVSSDVGYDCVPCDRCGGVCTDFQTSSANCGGCNQACAPRDGDGHCEAGQCVIDVCYGNFFDADGDAANGCEADALPAVPGSCSAAPGGFSIALVCGIAAVWSRRRSKRDAICRG